MLRSIGKIFDDSFLICSLRFSWRLKVRKIETSQLVRRKCVMKKILAPPLVLVSAMFAPTLAAQTDMNSSTWEGNQSQRQFFIGLKSGHQWSLDDSYNHSNPQTNILGVYGGLKLTPSWSWDLGYQYHEKLEADAASVDIKTWLIESALRYDWYLQDNLSLYGRLGIAYWEMEKTQLAFFNSDAAGFSPIGEVGVNYVFTPNVQLSVGYQYIDAIGNSNLGKYDSYGILASLTYTFGNAPKPTIVESSHKEPPVIEELPVTGAATVISESQTAIFSLTNTTILEA